MTNETHDPSETATPTAPAAIICEDMNTLFDLLTTIINANKPMIDANPEQGVFLAAASQKGCAQCSYITKHILTRLLDTIFYPVQHDGESIYTPVADALALMNLPKIVARHPEILLRLLAAMPEAVTESDTPPEQAPTIN